MFRVQFAGCPPPNSPCAPAYALYAAIHNFGFKGTVSKRRKRGRIFSAKMNMPQREFMRLDKMAIDDLYVELYLEAKDLLIEQEIRRKAYGD